METCINANGVIICNECSQKHQISGQIETDTEKLFCEICGDLIN